jgi:cell division protein FtsB
VRRLSSENRRAYLGMLAAAASLVAALTYHVFCGEHGYLALRREKQQFRTLQEQANKLQQENDNLEKQITALKNDPKTIEKRARENSLMVKKGEYIILYSDTKPKASSGLPAQDEAPVAPGPPPMERSK